MPGKIAGWLAGVIQPSNPIAPANISAQFYKAVPACLTDRPIGSKAAIRNLDRNRHVIVCGIRACPGTLVFFDAEANASVGSDAIIGAGVAVPDKISGDLFAGTDSCRVVDCNFADGLCSFTKMGGKQC